jgi:Tfp pilus assembly protein PilX
MKTLYKLHIQRPAIRKQRGVVLFFAMIALVVMSLAAVALIRSVDTSTMIAGNLAFKQTATNSGTGGIETALAWLDSQQSSSNTDPLTNGTHPFNSNHTANGYYSSFNANLNIFDNATWNSLTETVDDSGNKIKTIIQRMCRVSIPNTPAKDAECLKSGVSLNKSSTSVVGSAAFCKSNCSSSGSPIMMRITVRTSGLKNTVSYLQAFAY